MAKNKDRDVAVDPVSLETGGWDKMVDNWRARPKFYLGMLIAAGVLLVGGIIGWRIYKTKKQESARDLSTRIETAINERDLTEKVTLLLDAEGAIKGTDREPWFLAQLSRALIRQGEAEASPSKKISIYENALERAERLKNEFGESLVASASWKPSTLLTGSPAPNVATRLIATCEERLAFLRKHPATTTQRDSNFSATIELKDPDGKTRKLKLHFFSKEAPYSVDGFVWLAQEGHLTGTRVYGIEKDDAKTDDVHSVALGSLLSRLAPKHPQLWGTEKDFPGFTLPLEVTPHAPKRGSVTMDRLQENGVAVGINPCAIMICTRPQAFEKQRPVLGEVDLADPESRETLEALERTPPTSSEESAKIQIDHARIFPTDGKWVITNIAVEGKPSTPPPASINKTFQLPEAPKEDPLPEDNKKEGDAKPEKEGEVDPAKSGDEPEKKAEPPPAKK